MFERQAATARGEGAGAGAAASAGAAAGAEPGAEAKPANRRRRMLLIAGAVLALAGIGFAGYAWYQGWFGGQSEQPAATAAAGASSYVDVPAMIVNLRSSDGRARLLKLHFMLVPADPARAEAVKARLPVYLDALQPFLRELRPEDLNGSAAVFRIKEEMMARANDSLGSGAVKDVLIQDLIEQ
jgi:flagellar FliL protein